MNICEYVYRFPDHLCEEIGWCQTWVGPEELKEREIRGKLEQVLLLNFSHHFITPIQLNSLISFKLPVSC